jgi:predicted phosphodiesterase
MSTEKDVVDLGNKTGKLIFFGGVYSNLQALEALKQWADANEYSPDNIFCTGDILGYCAQPLECIRLLQQWGIQAIAGNVELQVRSNKADCGCDFDSSGRCALFSRNWYAYVQSRMHPEAIDWLYTLPHHIQFSYGGSQVTLVHGSWFHTADYIFSSTPWQVKEASFAAAGADVIIAGHCGLPFDHVHEGKLWLNAGVIGMPANDGTNRVWFMTLEQKENGLDYQFHHLAYDYQKASKLMRMNGLPHSYADTLVTGIWDNCEILPPEETARQGKRIVFA